MPAGRRVGSSVAIILALALAVWWVMMAIVTWRAVTVMGLNASGDIFFGDLAHPWRAQFNVDFFGHLLLVAAWIVARAPTPLRGMAFAILAIVGGSLFSFAYMIAVLVQSRGNLRLFLLGRQARAITSL